MDYSKTKEETVDFLEVTEPSEEIKKQMHNLALLNLTSKQQAIQQLTAGHSNAKPLATTTKITCSGQLTIAFAVIYNTLNLHPLNFKGYSKSYNFLGSGFGVGLGGGVAWFTGVFTRTPQQLVNGGKVDYHLATVSPGTVVTFSQGGTVIGSVVAAGISIGSGVFPAGTGDFS